jgi:hypothetical protein
LKLFRGLAFAVTAFMKKNRTFVSTSYLKFAFIIAISFFGQLVMALMITDTTNVFLLFNDNVILAQRS